MFYLGLAIGLVVGVIFHVGLRKWFDKAKAKAEAIKNDMQRP